MGIIQKKPASAETPVLVRTKKQPIDETRHVIKWPNPNSQGVIYNAKTGKTIKLTNSLEDKPASWQLENELGERLRRAHRKNLERLHGYTMLNNSEPKFVQFLTTINQIVKDKIQRGKYYVLPISLAIDDKGQVQYVIRLLSNYQLRQKKNCQQQILCMSIDGDFFMANHWNMEDKVSYNGDYIKVSSCKFSTVQKFVLLHMH